jgi:hypothetical protein
MIALDDYKKWLTYLQENAGTFLNNQEYKDYCQISLSELEAQLKAILEIPITSFTVINELYFRARWAEVLHTFYPNQNITLLEVATGDADMIPQMMGHIRPGSRYITANMNKHLNHSLLEKTKNVPVQMELIEDDAAFIEKHIGKDSVDLIAFQHAVNDVIQAILCDREGVDTIYADWMETLPKMIEILQREVAQDTLELHSKDAFLGLIRTLLKVLKSGGVIAMNHYMFQLDLDWGYPANLFENMLPIVRQWLHEITECEEIVVDGFNSNWWIFLRKA